MLQGPIDEALDPLIGDFNLRQIESADDVGPGHHEKRSGGVGGNPPIDSDGCSLVDLELSERKSFPVLCVPDDDLRVFAYAHDVVDPPEPASEGVIFLCAFRENGRQLSAVFVDDRLYLFRRVDPRTRHSIIPVPMMIACPLPDTVLAFAPSVTGALPKASTQLTTVPSSVMLLMSS